LVGSYEYYATVQCRNRFASRWNTRTSSASIITRKGMILHVIVLTSPRRMEDVVMAKDMVVEVDILGILAEAGVVKVMGKASRYPMSAC